MSRRRGQPIRVEAAAQTFASIHGLPLADGGVAHAVPVAQIGDWTPASCSFDTCRAVISGPADQSLLQAGLPAVATSPATLRPAAPSSLQTCGRHLLGNCFTDRYQNEWGASFNYDGEGSRAVRDFIVGNAVYWIKDFYLDGLRIDAAQAMFDASDQHIIAEITQAVRAAAGRRRVYVVVENQPQEHLMIDTPQHGGYGVDAMVSDDFQHAVRVAITGRNDFYYRDYLGTPQAGRATIN